MVSLLVYLLVVGIVAGFAARLVVPGRDPMGFWKTTLLGVAGSFIGGTLGSLAFEGVLAFRPSGIAGSILGAIVALLLYRRSARRRAVTS